MLPQHRTGVIQRAISALTHQNITTTELDGFKSPMTVSIDQKVRLLTQSPNGGRMRANVAKLLNDFFLRYLRQIKVCPCSDDWRQSNQL